MVTIYKLRVNVARSRLSFHRGAKIVACQMQNGVICLWYMCNTDAAMCERLVSFYVTGGAIPPEAGNHVGTVQDGPYVLHVFVDAEPAR